MFLWIAGRLRIDGYSPDGDSVRFTPDSPATLRRLANGDAIEVSDDDGSVQLRLDAIDAPELHYQDTAQPLARPSRDRLVERAGFTDVTYDDEDVVTAATPTSVEAAIVAQMAETYGRPVALLLVGDAATGHADGDEVDPLTVVDTSLNATLVRDGLVYLTLYTSTPAAVRERFVALARDAGAGSATPPAGTVWAADRSGGFTLTALSDVGPDGALILPKLFRRCVAYLDTDTDTDQRFADWLAGQGDDDDPVEVDGRRTTLSALVTQDSDRISLTASPLDLAFVETVSPNGDS